MQQHFNPDAPNLVWASDITYLRANGKWNYLCVIIDLFSRKVIGWDLSNKIDSDLVIPAFSLIRTQSLIVS
ncbi:MAG: DDE-type integrase/transposase/recombinase [Oscillospiraceae bacterium]|nr:DDE-type integrase/transposase/recombinase [Oscillospiraceae bacterium]